MAAAWPCHRHRHGRSSMHTCSHGVAALALAIGRGPTAGHSHMLVRHGGRSVPTSASARPLGMPPLGLSNGLSLPAGYTHVPAQNGAASAQALKKKHVLDSQVAQLYYLKKGFTDRQRYKTDRQMSLTARLIELRSDAGAVAAGGTIMIRLTQDGWSAIAHTSVEDAERAD